jgi:hypothetical protein
MEKISEFIHSRIPGSIIKERKKSGLLLHKPKLFVMLLVGYSVVILSILKYSPSLYDLFGIVLYSVVGVQCILFKPISAHWGSKYRKWEIIVGLILLINVFRYFKL